MRSPGARGTHAREGGDQDLESGFGSADGGVVGGGVGGEGGAGGGVDAVPGVEACGSARTLPSLARDVETASSPARARAGSSFSHTSGLGPGRPSFLVPVKMR
jgi:hypothetical protein